MCVCPNNKTQNESLCNLESRLSIAFFHLTPSFPFNLKTQLKIHLSNKYFANEFAANKPELVL